MLQFHKRKQYSRLKKKKTVMRMCAFQMQHDKYSANSQVDQVNQEMVS